MSDSSIKQVVLRRRAGFIAAALAATGVGTSGCCDKGGQPCLSIDTPPGSASTEIAPEVCLKIAGDHESTKHKPSPPASTPPGPASK